MRVVFLIIQTLLVAFSESGVSYFQLRILIVIWLNCAIKACSVDANPAETFVILWIDVSPVFNHFDTSMKENQTNPQPVFDFASDELPMSMPTKSKKSDRPSLWEVLKSCIFMSYLLVRRHELTPDLFHFVTCVEQDSQHMLWLFVLWVSMR